MPKRSRSGVASRPGAGGGADQGERRQVDAHGARGRPLADDQVELEILHRRIEDLLDRRLQAVDLVDEQHVAGLQVGQDRGQVAGALDHRAGGGAEADAQLARDDLRQRGLAEAGRAVQQHVVQRLAAGARGGDEDGEVLPRRRCWPTKSARVCGRSEASAASSSRRAGETVRSASLKSWVPESCVPESYVPGAGRGLVAAKQENEPPMNADERR